MLALSMVLSFVMPFFQAVAQADSEEDYYVPPAAESSDDYYIPPASKSSETFFDTTPELSPDDYYTPPVGQSVGTYFTVRDQYGRPVDNVIFSITNINAKPQTTDWAKAVNGVLWIHYNGSYQNISVENAGFNPRQYHDIKAYPGRGNADNYTLDGNAVLSRFYLSNGNVFFEKGSSTNIVLQSKEAPPTPPPTDAVSMTAKDTKNLPAEGIAFRLYKEGQANIQGYFISNSAGNLVYSANGELFDAAALDVGTYTLKATPQVSTDAAKEKYSIDSTKVYTTITVTADDNGKKSVAFSPEGSQNLVFPLIESIPKGKANLTVNKVDENGKPLRGATFQLAGPVDSDAAGSRTSTETNVEGKTVFSNLAYGEYILKEVSAPEGYVVSKKEIHVMLGKDSDTPYVGGEDVTDRLTLTSVKWNPPHIEDGVNTIYPNQAESLTVDSVIKVPTDGDPIVPGDTFTVQLSDNVDTYGLVRSAEQGLDIFANGGKLAEGKFDPKTRTITYTFTNLMKTFKANEIKLHTVLFIDKVVVPQEVKAPSNLELTYGLQGKNPSKSNFQVFYKPYYYPQVTGGSNVGTMYSIYNPDKKTATTYIYVNPLHNSLKKSKLEITGKGSVLVNDLTDVKVYDGGSRDPNTMVPSWGLVPDNLTQVTDFKPQIDGNRGKITIDLDDRLMSREKAYIVKVTTGYDPSSTDDLGMVAKLYGYHNGYWSRYYNYSYYDYDWAAAQTYMKFYEHEASATGVGFNASVKVSNAKNYIEWTKVNESGIPLEGAEFKLVRVDGANETDVKNGLRSDRDGHLSASDLAPGSYKLYETTAPEGYEIPKDKDGVMSVFSVNEDGEITEMDPADGKLVNGRSEGRFSIHKTDNAEKEEDRKPLKGAEFTLTPLKKDGTPDTSKAVVKTTDENGDLTFSGLPLGKYQLKETKPAPGYLLRDTTWTVVVEKKSSIRIIRT